jgi:DNA-binding PadR family transcriptional regulator
MFVVNGREAQANGRGGERASLSERGGDSPTVVDTRNIGRVYSQPNICRRIIVADLRRKVANPLALAVLVLLYERPMHPYEMAATLRERRKEESIKLRYGSLYTVIEQLVKAGFIAQKKTTREGNRPERTVYEINKAGEGEMRDWMREILSTPSKEYLRFEAGLSLLPALPPEDVTDLLETRMEFLKKDIEQIKTGMQQAKAMELPALFSIESEYRLAGLETELGFVESLILRIRKDGCGFLKQWKQWHAEKAPRKKGK